MDFCTIDDFNREPLKVAGIDTELSGTPTASALSVMDDLQGFIDKYQAKYLKLIRAQYDNAFNTALSEVINGLAYNPIACYIYFYYERYTNTKQTATGEVKYTAPNSQTANGDSRIVKVWNLMCEGTDEIIEGMKDKGFELVSPFYAINIFGI